MDGSWYGVQADRAGRGRETMGHSKESTGNELRQVVAESSVLLREGDHAER